MIPGLIPPPANHMVNACGWWSRPRLRPSAAFDSTIGVRPNSPPQTTRVSSSSPRRFRSVDQGRRGPVGLAALVLEAAGDVGVVVPALVIEVDEPDPALDQAAGEQAVVGERRLARLGPVEVEGLLASRPRGPSARGAGLHPVGQLVGGDPGLDLGVADGVEVAAVEPPDEVDRVALEPGVDARAGWRR